MSFSTYVRSRPAVLWDSREWIDYVRKTVRGYRYTSRAQLNDHDWDDIAQIATIHAWKKRALYDESKPLKPWLKVVTLSQIRNEIRNRVVYGGSKSATLRHYVENPSPILTRNVIVSRGVEEVQYEPDAIDPRTLPGCLQREDLPKLGEIERETLTRLMDCPKPSRVVKRELKKGKVRGHRNLVQLYKRRDDLRAIYRAALNG